MNDVWGENWRLEPELELEIMILLEVDKKNDQIKCNLSLTKKSDLCHLKSGRLHELDMNYYHNSVNLCS